MSAPRILPRLDSDNRFFWTSGADGQLRFLRCQECATFIHPAAPGVSPLPVRESRAAKPLRAPGTIDTYTVNYQQWQPGLEVPYVIARVAIDGAPGVFLTTNIVGCAVEAVEIGDRVRVKFEQQGDVYLPLFEKIA